MPGGPHRHRAPGPVQPVRAARGGTQEDVRRHNLGTLLTHLHESGPLTRAELTARMGLNRSTIAVLVSELAALGAVQEQRPDAAAHGQSGAGRPSLVVMPAGDQVQVLAADIAVDRVTVALIGLGGTVATRRTRRQSDCGPDAVLELVLALVEEVLADPAAGQSVVGLGIALPGVIRQSDGCVRFAPNLAWVDVPFGDMLQRRLPDLPIWLGNDADLGLLAEHRRGAARGVDDVVFLAGEVGVGGGMVLGGRPVVGAGGYAGELGHMVIRPGGRRCRCGAHGCWETEIGLPAVARALHLPEDAASDELIAALARVEPDDGTLTEVGRYLGLGMASIINLVNPRLFIVGGLLREVFPLVQQQVEETLRAAALTAPADQARVAVPALGGDSALFGASELAWSDLLADPTAVLGGRDLQVMP
ncbi:MAG: ROK family transcriptional regulator [Kineosporiaceae bacterium]